MYGNVSTAFMYSKHWKTVYIFVWNRFIATGRVEQFPLLCYKTKELQATVHF